MQLEDFKKLTGDTIAQRWEVYVKPFLTKAKQPFDDLESEEKSLILDGFYEQLNREWVKIDGLYYWRTAIAGLYELTAKALNRNQ